MKTTKVSIRKRAVKMLATGTPVAEIAKEFGVSNQTIYNWRDQLSNSQDHKKLAKRQPQRGKETVKFEVDSEWMPTRTAVEVDAFRGAIIEHAAKLKAGESFPIPVQELVRRYGQKSATSGAIRHVINRLAAEDVAGRVVVHEVKDGNKNLAHIRIRRPN